MSALSIACPYVDRTTVLCAGPVPETCPSPCGPSQMCCPTACSMECVKIPVFPPIKPPTLPPKGVCPVPNPNIQCIWYNEQCNEVDKKCNSNQVCCKDQCGSKCVNVAQPPTNPFCPKLPNSNIQCFRFDEQCNDSDKRCGRNQVCCPAICGTKCSNVGPSPSPYPVPPFPVPQYPSMPQFPWQLPNTIDRSYFERIMLSMRPQICKSQVYRG